MTVLSGAENIVVSDEQKIVGNENQDLSREWKLLRQFATSCMMFYNEYRSSVVEHQKRIDDEARTARKQVAIKANKTIEDTLKEQIQEIKNCEYD